MGKKRSVSNRTSRKKSNFAPRNVKSADNLKEFVIHEKTVPADHTSYPRRYPAIAVAKRMFCARYRHGRPGGAIHHRDQADADERLPSLELEP